MLWPWLGQWLSNWLCPPSPPVSVAGVAADHGRGGPFLLRLVKQRQSRRVNLTRQTA